MPSSNGGGRVLPGLFFGMWAFLVAVAAMSWVTAALISLPAVIAVGLSGWWFRLSATNGAWLPDARSLISYLVAGLALPIASGIAICAGLANAIGMVDVGGHWPIVAAFWMEEMLVAVSISVPLLMFLTRPLALRAWSVQSADIPGEPLFVDTVFSLPRPLLLVVLLCVLGFASVFFTPMQLAMTFGATLLAIALYFGPGASALSIAWVVLLGFTAGRLSAGEVEDLALTNAQAALLVFSIFGLLMSRTLADMRNELEQRRSAENAYLASEQRLRGILRAAPLGVGVVRAGRLVWVSDSMAEMFGYARSDVVGRSLCSFLMDKRKYREISRYFARGSTNGRAASVEVLVERNGGIPMWADIRASALDEGNIKAGLVFTVLDIADRKQAQQARERLQRELAQTQKMEAIGSLTGGIAHEFNNILASVLGYTELARDRFAAECPDKLGVYLGQVISAGHRARDLVAQMLRFSRGSAGSAEPLELAPLVKEVSKMLRNTLPASIRIEVDAQPDQSKVVAEPLQLHQVLVNLAVNARDAMNGSGTLAITVRREPCFRAECSACHKEVNGDYQVISISDTGPGIAQENLARIFDPFFSTRQVGDGSGLGLSVTHTLLHQQGAHIVVESVSGEGTTFRLCFPVASDKPLDESNELPGYLPQGRGRVLVVEDDALLSDYFRELLTIAGYDVQIYSNGESALEDLGRDRIGFDLLITDQTMPGMSGLDLISRVRARFATLPIMLCTGYAEGLDESVAVAAGADAFLYKPLDSAKLLDEIGKLLRA